MVVVILVYFWVNVVVEVVVFPPAVGTREGWELVSVSPRDSDDDRRADGRDTGGDFWRSCTWRWARAIDACICCTKDSSGFVVVSVVWWCDGASRCGCFP